MSDSKKKIGGRKLDKRASRPGDGTGNGNGELEGDPIVAELRRLYDGVIDEPLPDQLMELLRKLDEVERNR